MTIYIPMIILTVFLADIQERIRYRGRKISILLITLLPPTLVAAFRYNNGADYPMYFQLFTRLGNGSKIAGMGAFMGKEEPQDSTTYVINPGLGMAAEQGNGFCLDVIEYYKTIHFDFNNIITVCEHVTRCLKKKGYIGNNKIEKIDGFTLYPTEYFCPKNYYTNEMRMTRNTCSIHHYTSSWSSAKFTRFHVFETKIMKIFGPKVSDFFMVKLARNIYCNGLAVTVKKVLRLYKK